MKTINQPLRVYAGEQALRQVRAQGLSPSDIEILLGASSGPKWLVLHGIDRYLQQFLKGSQSDLELLGTSAGAWRMATYAHQDTERAHHALTDAYIEQRYSAKPSGEEIQAGCREVIREVLGDGGAESVLSTKARHLNVIATQCHGLTATRNKQIKSLGYGLAAINNRLSRKTLAWQFSRILMHDPRSQLFNRRLKDLPTRYVDLYSGNLENTLLATGAIPVIIDGVEGLAGKGVYQDGGITDYAFDLPLLPKNGLVLFPHFANIPAPGWFDKGWINQYRPWRKPSKDNYAKTLMLVPSEDFIASLPFKKIPDRHDFLNLSDQDRIRYWRKVVAQTEALAEDLATMHWQSRVEALPW